ncbi:hypothetical protein [Desulfobacter curvatus]|uniref:hypothetical protein n=1 Tax=Desulfobacter curvatus TaxID=2290 RepID=UPI000376DA79|nr:hypothetical protein [Desulfobacter curvatus]
MKNLILFLSVSLLFYYTSGSAFAIELMKSSALNGKVTFEAPKELSPMSKEMLELKYPSSRRPTEVLSDSTGGVSLAFNHLKSAATNEQVIEVHKNMSKAFHNMYPSASWFRDEVITKNGKNIMVLELITPAMNTKIHNIMYGLSVDDRLLLVAFNTTVEQSEKWLSIGKKIMSSIEVESR